MTVPNPVYIGGGEAAATLEPPSACTAGGTRPAPRRARQSSPRRTRRLRAAQPTLDGLTEQDVIRGILVNREAIVAIPERVVDLVQEWQRNPLNPRSRGA